MITARVRMGFASIVLATTSSAAYAQGAPTATVAEDQDDLIVVTGTATPVQFDRIGSSLTVIDGETIERKNVAYLQDVLREVPGLAVNQTGSFGQLTQVRIRGAEGNHTLVLVDGIEVSSIGSGEFDFSSLLASNIDRVEVLRGPQSGLYGSNALAGVINVITRGGDGPLLDAAVEGGSFGTVMGRATVTLGDRETFLSASGTFRSTDGISAAEVGSEADGDRNLTGYLRGGVRLAPFARLDATLRFVDKETEADGFDFSGGPLQGLAIDSDDFSDTQEWSGGATLTVDASDQLQFVANGAYTDFTSTGGSGDVGTFGNEGDRLKLGGHASFDVNTGPRVAHTITAFVDYEEENYRNTFPADASQIPEQGRDLLGIGAEYRLDLFDQLFLKAAVRRDENSDFADTTTYSLTGSWVVDATGSRLHASYGTGVTNPTFTEQFGYTPGQFVGNPNLSPEKSEGFDIGIEQRIGEVALLDLAYFQATLEDEIVSSFPTVINQLGESDRAGVEFTARFNLGALSLGGTYTYLDASDPDGTVEVRRPEHQASFDASLDFGPESRGNINLGVIYNGEMRDNDYRDYYTNGFVAVKSPVDEYVVVRVAGSYQLTDRVQLFGRVENLLDENYQEVISYGTPGLSAYGGVRLVLP